MKHHVFLHKAGNFFLGNAIKNVGLVASMKISS